MEVLGLLSPPLTSRRPSDRYAIPGQNMSECAIVSVLCTDLPVAGSKIAVYVRLGASPRSPGKPNPLLLDHIKTFPLGRKAAATGMTGNGMTSVHAPPA